MFARYLRLARLLSTGGRGTAGADQAPSDCTNMVLAMTSGFLSKDAAEAIKVYRPLKANGPWQRDKGAPSIAWLNELEGAPLGTIIDRLIAAAMTEEFADLERAAIKSTTVGNWYLLVRINSPKPSAEILIGGGVAQFGGHFRKYNKVIAEMHFAEGSKKAPMDFDFEDAEVREKFIAAQRGWTSDRVRTESISRGTIKALGALLVAGKSK